MYVYKCSERPGEFGDNTGLWTVGHYEPKSGAWIAESDHPSTDEASARVAMLNGTSRTQQLVTLDTRLNVLIGQFNALEGRVGTIDQHVTRSLALLGRMLQREASRAGLSPESTASKEVAQVLEQLVATIKYDPAIDDREPELEYPEQCSSPNGHEWNRTAGEADEARLSGDIGADNIRCIHCGADGDA